ncbi:hypothetical protein [Candidatus Protochlamydia amoebophila]|uniref:Uncharacterized protein n=1 Tax=Candidatus Protochlamydia amoebophila TaxID=362787 RepID=A0A0C1JT93_9BACT|nr:hypothetical protein [Candidatus Protochlamydia amoebophila]KIC74325.1 hypothetical protein DB44_AL00190 [Candidatus Protochlamydia amoebophila]
MHACTLILEDYRTIHIEGIYLSLDQLEQLITREKMFDADAEVVKKLLNYKNFCFRFMPFHQK